MLALSASRKLVLVPRAATTVRGQRRYGLARVAMGPPPRARPPAGLDHLKRTHD